ncbi:MAG: hypothetical protein FWH37_06355 [Candidatus Bathyarchaeota archaeon]|nr:hypothetical protein [Candidatus Termiticorpusculum sp.]
MTTTTPNNSGCRVVRARINAVFDPMGSRAPQQLGLRAWNFCSLAIAMPHNSLAPRVHTLISSTDAFRNAIVPFCLSALGNTMTT